MTDHLGQCIFHMQQPLLHRLKIWVLAQRRIVHNPGVVHRELQLLVSIHWNGRSTGLHGWSDFGLGLDESVARKIACLVDVSSSGLSRRQHWDGLLGTLVLFHLELDVANQSAMAHHFARSVLGHHETDPLLVLPRSLEGIPHVLLTETDLLQGELGERQVADVGQRHGCLLLEILEPIEQGRHGTVVHVRNVPR